MMVDNYNGQGQLSQQLFNPNSQELLKLMQIKLKTEYNIREKENYCTR